MDADRILPTQVLIFALDDYELPASARLRWDQGRSYSPNECQCR